jgi:hypothetical protein
VGMSCVALASQTIQSASSISKNWRVLYGVFFAVTVLLDLGGYLANESLADRTSYPGRLVWIATYRS